MRMIVVGLCALAGTAGAAYLQHDAREAVQIGLLVGIYTVMLFKMG